MTCIFIILYLYKYIEPGLPCLIVRLFPPGVEQVIITFISWTGKAEEWTEEELEQTAEAIGYGAIK